MNSVASRVLPAFAFEVNGNAQTGPVKESIYVRFGSQAHVRFGL